MAQNTQRDPRTLAIIGAAMDVHRELGCGFLEAVYQEALEMEFTDRGIPFCRELELPITFKGRKLTTFYRADFVCFGEVVVDLKALNAIGSIEEAKMINYLKATKLEVGLVVNFGAESLQFKRLVRTVDRDHSADRDAEGQA